MFLKPVFTINIVFYMLWPILCHIQIFPFFSNTIFIGEKHKQTVITMPGSKVTIFHNIFSTSTLPPFSLTSCTTIKHTIQKERKSIQQYLQWGEQINGLGTRKCKRKQDKNIIIKKVNKKKTNKKKKLFQLDYIQPWG